MVSEMVQLRKQVTCIVCPLSCSGEVLIESGTAISITGFSCQRGENYANEEVTAPRRMLTTTVKVQGGELLLLPVRSEKPLPKEHIRRCARLLSQVVIKAPIAAREVICANILGLGTNIIASREISAKAEDVK